MANIPEEALLALAVKNKGGGGGTTNYNDLDNQPQIGGNTLIGNKSASDLSLASLDANGKVPSSQLPSYVDDVVEGYYDASTDRFYEESTFETVITPVEGKSWVDIPANKSYRWTGSVYVRVDEGVQIGETSDTAYAGNKGKANADAIAAIKDGQTIDSFADVETALAGKQGTLTAGDYINLNNGNIAVNRNLVGDNYDYEIKSTGDYKLTIIKSQGGTVISTNTYDYSYGTSTNIDNNFTIAGAYSGGNTWVYTALKDSTTHSVGYTWTKSVDASFEETESFPSEDLSGYKLIIKSEMDTALSGKQDTLTFDDTPTDGSNNPVKSNGVYDALATKADLTDLAPAFSAETAYTVGQYVSYDGNIYKCTSAHSAGAWVAGDFTLVAVGSELSSLKSGFTNLDNEVNGDATVYPYADVITIPDAVPSNLADCSVKIDPVQDLHGYDKPWVGGAGKNKFDGVSVISANINSSGVISNESINNRLIYTPCKANTTYTVSKTAGTSFRVAYCDSIPTFGTQCSGLITDNTASSITITTGDSAGYIVAWVWNITDTTDVSDMIASVQVEEGSTATTWEPWSNICPILGHTEASVQRDGKNLLNPVFEQGSSLDTGSTRIRCKNTILVESGKTYTFSASDYTNYKYSIDSSPTDSYPFDSAMLQYVGNPSGWNTQAVTFTATNSGYVAILVSKSDNSSIAPNDISGVNLQLELGSSATDYVPYAGKTYTIALGDTIYGGTVRIDSNGNTVMDVDRAVVEYDGSNDETWYDNKIENGYSTPRPTGLVDSICDKFKNAGARTSVQGEYWAGGSNLNFVCSEIITSLVDWKTYLASNPLQICYELATPFTIQLTPQQIQLLKGTNTLTASTGQISVTVNGVSGSIGQVQEQVNELVDRTIHSKDVSLDGVELNIHVGDVWYQKVTVTLPTGACIIGVSYGTQFEPDVIPYVQSTNAVILTCASTKTISNKVMTVYYANIA